MTADNLLVPTADDFAKRAVHVRNPAFPVNHQKRVGNRVQQVAKITPFLCQFGNCFFQLFDFGL